MWPYSTCHTRLVCYSWLPQVLVKSTPSSMREDGVLLLPQTEKALHKKEDQSLKYWWDSCLFCCSKEVHFSHQVREQEMSLVQCYASVCFILKKSVAPCKHWIQRCEINIALLKSTTLSHSKDSQPSLSTKVEESTFRILTQLTLPWHNTPLWRWNERFKHLDVRLKQNGTVNKCM